MWHIATYNYIIVTVCHNVNMKKHCLINLKTLRNEAGMSQADLAVILKIERSTVAKYETGDRYPDIETLCKIADALGVTTDELLGRN